jgi:hypothetical protein
MYLGQEQELAPGEKWQMIPMQRHLVQLFDCGEFEK